MEGCSESALEKSGNVITRGKAVVRLDVKLERSLRLIQDHLQRITWGKCREELMDRG